MPEANTFWVTCTRFLQGCLLLACCKGHVPGFPPVAYCWHVAGAMCQGSQGCCLLLACRKKHVASIPKAVCCWHVVGHVVGKVCQVSPTLPAVDTSFMTRAMFCNGAPAGQLRNVHMQQVALQVRQPAWFLTCMCMIFHFSKRASHRSTVSAKAKAQWHVVFMSAVCRHVSYYTQGYVRFLRDGLFVTLVDVTNSKRLSVGVARYQAM